MTFQFRGRSQSVPSGAELPLQRSRNGPAYAQLGSSAADGRADANGCFDAPPVARHRSPFGPLETKLELTAPRYAVLIDRLARNVHELWHAVSFLLAILARCVTYFGKARPNNWRTKKKLA